MVIGEVPFTAIDWDAVDSVEMSGASGIQSAKTVERGSVRVRRVDFSPGYMANHWCARGHVVLVTSGELVIELSDGSARTLRDGAGFIVGDDVGTHRARTDAGAQVFIID